MALTINEQKLAEVILYRMGLEALVKNPTELFVKEMKSMIERLILELQIQEITLRFNQTADKLREIVRGDNEKAEKEQGNTG